MSDKFTDDEKTGFYKAIYSRRDVRSHFTQEPIDEGTLTKILHAAHHAPSVGFSQPWNFILIKDVILIMPRATTRVLFNCCLGRVYESGHQDG